MSGQSPEIWQATLERAANAFLVYLPELFTKFVVNIISASVCPSLWWLMLDRKEATLQAEQKEKKF
jgi:hypothetical protein